MTTIVTILALAICAFAFRKHIPIINKIFSIGKAKTDNIINEAMKDIDVLKGKVADLYTQKNNIIKSLAKMKAIELSNNAKIEELEKEIQKIEQLAKKYKEKNNKEKALQMLQLINNKTQELQSLKNSITLMQSNIDNGEKQLIMFNTHINDCETKVSILENKYETANMMTEVTGIDSGIDLKKLLKDFDIKMDTKIITGEIKLEENKYKNDLVNIDIENQYDNL